MTCLFDPVAFAGFYSSSILYDSAKTQAGKSYKTISDFAFIEPYVRSREIVIVYGKSSSGATHFMVVKGVEGTRTIYDIGYIDVQVNNFMINDPGANRVTLSQFLLSYQTITAIYVYNKK